MSSERATDATERRCSEEQQRLLARELNHRVKNLLSIVTAIIVRTHRTQSADDFLPSVAWCMERANPDKAATELALLASVHILTYVAAGPLAGWAAGRFDFPLFLGAAAALAAGVALLLMPLLRQRRGRAAV